MTVDAINMKITLRRAARMAAALDLYATICDQIGDTIEAQYATYDRDVIRRYLAEQYGDVK